MRERYYLYVVIYIDIILENRGEKKRCSEMPLQRHKKRKARKNACLSHVCKVVLGVATSW